jgi:hypothetical protein
MICHAAHLQNISLASCNQGVGYPIIDYEEPRLWPAQPNLKDREDFLIEKGGG